MQQSYQLARAEYVNVSSTGSGTLVSPEDTGDSSLNSDLHQCSPRKCSETGTAPGWRSRLSSTVSGSSGSSSFEASVECALGNCLTKPDLFDETGCCSMFSLNRPPDDGVPSNGLSRPLSEYFGRCFKYLGGCFLHLSLVAQIRLQRMNIMLGSSLHL